ncbi:MFS transporter [Jatrophihabitans sp.]|uniref:MFS transporter n=1 Tax=Jatrophihabitans sp. TaxID=1932789 RepID=UPI0030C7120A|nr:transporter [Jatrophihabitans sp.]
MPRRAFWFTAFAFTATMIGTTLPTPLYPAYEERFDFGPLTVTVVFAMYAVGVLAALLLVGRASDTVGRRPVLLAGLAVSALSSVVFLVVGGVHSDGVGLLLLGRLLSGLSAGIFTGTATATLADFARPGGQLRASLIAAVANIGGLGLGPLIGGLLARFVAAPLRTSFAVHLGLIVLATAAILAIPEPVEVVRPRRLRVQRLQVPAQARAVLVQAGTAGFAGFAVLGLFTAVCPAVLALLGHHNPALTGLVVFSVFAASAAGQLASARVPTETALLAGTGTLVVGIAGVGSSIAASSLPLLVAGGIVSGLGQGLSFRAALGSVTGASPEHQRGGVASTFFAICYVGISLPVVGVGIGTRAYGLAHTGEVFAVIIALLSLAALTSLWHTRPEPAA